uniref:Sodefrin-like factor F n=1 Tax=Boana cinerascens TaxID=2364978 RepID=A0A513ZV69_9NEOB|nr:sodefrin precursor-like factor F [Boana cinerascens]
MKSSYIRILFVVVALIYSVQSNDCSKCWNVGETKCCGNQTMTCPESSCMTISERCTVDGIEHKTVRKTCGDNTTCGSCFSISTNQGLTLRTSTQCRKGYKSNANLNYKITCEALEKENGYWCPACYKNNSMDGCEATHTINCKGAETACLEFRGVIQIADGTVKKISVKGCIFGCGFGYIALPGVKILTTKILTCTPAEKISEED